MVTDQVSYIEYTGNNSTTTGYAIPFDYQESTDISCYVDGVAYTTFSVSGSQVYTTTAVATTAVFRIERNVPDSQTLDLVPNGDLPAALTETTLDKIVMMVQQVRDSVLRCLRISRASTQTEPAEVAATTSHYLYIDASGNLVSRTSAQLAADVQAEITLPATLDRPTNIAADAAARAALVPDFTGQVMVQLDTGILYRSTGTSAGNWTETDDTAFQTFATAAARDAATPTYTGEIGRLTRGGSWYKAYGTNAGDWEWLAYGNYTPAAVGTWTPGGTSYTAGDLVRVPYKQLSAGNTLDSYTDANNVVLDTAAENFANDDDLNGCYIEITGGTGSGQKRRILDYTASSETVTTADWGTALDGTSVYRITWESGYAVYECLVDHSSHATSFPIDLNDGDWGVFLVEDYHYHQRGPSGETLPHEVFLGPSSRSEDWSPIIDEVYQLLEQAGGGAGITTKWGSEYVRNGTINFEDGIYDCGYPVKLVPLCSLQGRYTSHNQLSTGTRIRAEAAAIVSNGGNDYHCIQTHLAGADDEEPGVGGNWTTYWRQVAAWVNAATYNEGDVVTRSSTYYRCMVGHIASTGTIEPPSGGGVTLAGSYSDEWFKHWQPLRESPVAWATATFYSSGWDVEYHEYLIEGHHRGASANGHSCFATSLKNLHIDCYSTVRTGVYAWLSQGSVLENLDVDNFSRCGYRIGSGSDVFTAFGAGIQRLGSGAPGQYGWWFDGANKSIQMFPAQITKTLEGISCGDMSGLVCIGLETENCATPIVFRLKLHDEFDGTGGDDNGSPNGCRFEGVRLSRASDDTFVVSTNNIASVRFNQDRYADLTIDGFTIDQSAGGTPQDRVLIQSQSGSGRTVPLHPTRILNPGAWDDFSFDFSLREMIFNARFMGQETTEVDGKLVAETNPPTLTVNGTTNVALIAGLYRIEIKAANTYNGGTVTIQDEDGTAIPGMGAYNGAGELIRYHMHGGGNIDVVVAGTGGAADIDVYFRPWPSNYAEDNFTATLPDL